MSLTASYDHLVAEKPPISLLEIRMLLSLIIQGIVIVGFQVLAYLYCVYGNHYWFLKFNPPDIDTETYKSFEYYSVFVISIFQYPWVAIVMSKGIPFRKPLYTNWLFVINLLINFAADIFICFDPLPPFPPEPKNLVNAEYDNFGDLLELYMPPSMEYRGIIFLFACIYCGTSLLFELLFVDRSWLADALRSCYYRVSNKAKSKRRYEMMEDRLGNAAERWPPVKSAVKGAAAMFSPTDSHTTTSSKPFGGHNTFASTQFLLSPSATDLSASQASFGSDYPRNGVGGGSSSDMLADETAVRF